MDCSLVYSLNLINGSKYYAKNNGLIYQTDYVYCVTIASLGLVNLVISAVTGNLYFSAPFPITTYPRKRRVGRREQLVKQNGLPKEERSNVASTADPHATSTYSASIPTVTDD